MRRRRWSVERRFRAILAFRKALRVTTEWKPYGGGAWAIMEYAFNSSSMLMLSSNPRLWAL